MNAAKYEAGKYLNQLENQHKVISENIEKAEANLRVARNMQNVTATMIAEQRKAVAAMPD